MTYLRASWTGSAHGIKVIIDLHAASGSQNGQEHSSACNGISEWAKQGGTDYLYESIMATEFLASRLFSKPQSRTCLIELVF